MSVFGEQCATDIHAAGGNSDIIDWYFPSLCDQMVINKCVFPGYILVDIANANELALAAYVYCIRSAVP